MFDLFLDELPILCIYMIFKYLDDPVDQLVFCQLTERYLNFYYLIDKNELKYKLDRFKSKTEQICYQRQLDDITDKSIIDAKTDWEKDFERGQDYPKPYDEQWPQKHYGLDDRQHLDEITGIPTSTESRHVTDVGYGFLPYALEINQQFRNSNRQDLIVPQDPIVPLNPIAHWGKDGSYDVWSSAEYLQHYSKQFMHGLAEFNPERYKQYVLPTDESLKKVYCPTINIRTMLNYRNQETDILMKYDYKEIKQTSILFYN